MLNGLPWKWTEIILSFSRLHNLGWPCTAWLFAPLSYVSPFITTRRWPTKGIHSRGSIYTYTCTHALSCLSLCDPMDYSPQGYSVHGLSHARILEWWSAISLSRGSSQSRASTCVSCIDRWILYTEPPEKPLKRNIALQFFLMFLSEFGIKIMLSSLSELGSTPFSSFFSPNLTMSVF